MHAACFAPISAKHVSCSLRRASGATKRFLKRFVGVQYHIPFRETLMTPGIELSLLVMYLSSAAEA